MSLSSLRGIEFSSFSSFPIFILLLVCLCDDFYSISACPRFLTVVFFAISFSVLLYQPVFLLSSCVKISRICTTNMSSLAGYIKALKNSGQV